MVLRQHVLPLGHVAESGQPTTGVIVRRFYQCSTLPGGEVTSDRQRADIQARLVHWQREDLSFPSSQEIMMQRNWLTAVLCGVCCVLLCVECVWPLLLMCVGAVQGRNSASPIDSVWGCLPLEAILLILLDWTR